MASTLANRHGGGAATRFGDVQLQNTTVYGNVADADGDGSGGGGGIAVEPVPMPGTIRVANSIVAFNSPGLGGALGHDCTAGVVSEGHNVVGMDECGAFSIATYDVAGTLLDPLSAELGPLGDHGGPTASLLPGPTSPAVDLGDPAGCTADLDGDPATEPVVLTRDQRGYGRPADGDENGSARCDAGAIELLPEPRGLLAVVAALAALVMQARWKGICNSRRERVRHRGDTPARRR